MSYLGSTILQNILEFGEKETARENYLKKPKTKLLSFLQSFIVPFKLKNQFKDVSLIKQHQILGVWISIILKILLKKPLIVRTGYDMHAFAKQEKKKKHIQLLYFLLNQIGLFFAEIFTVSNTNDLQNKKEKYLANSNIELRSLLSFFAFSSSIEILDNFEMCFTVLRSIVI